MAVTPLPDPEATILALAEALRAHLGDDPKAAERAGARLRALLIRQVAALDDACAGPDRPYAAALAAAADRRARTVFAAALAHRAEPVDAEQARAAEQHFCRDPEDPMHAYWMLLTPAPMLLAVALRFLRRLGGGDAAGDRAGSGDRADHMIADIFTQMGLRPGRPGASS